MNKNILKYIEQCEGWKVGIKNLHWSADNMSQHELCDDIASEISDFEDLVSEVEQSISGKIKLNGFTPKSYKIVSLKSFVEDVISASQDFLKELDGMGKKYVGIKSECETFIGTMQRKLYLVNFTLKEELKRRLRDRINESMPKNPMNVDDGGFEKFMGRRPKSIRARINQIYKIVKKYGIDSRRYSDEHWQAIEDYYRAITSLGCEVEMKPCGHLSNADSIESDGGYCDYAEDGMPRSKQYAIKITFEDGMSIDGYIKCMACGTMEDPFSRYDTCMVLWPKQNKVLENKGMGKQIKLSESELKDFLRESVIKSLRSLREMNELYQDWYDEEDYDGNVGEEGMIRSYDIGTYYVGQAEEDARENGYDDVADYLEYWFSEIQSECPWYWQKVGSGYGYNGTTIFKNDGIVCKDIYGQIMVDEYPIGDARRDVQYESRKKVHALNETPLNYDIDNFSGWWTKPKNWNIPNRDLISGEEYIDDEGYLDDPYKSNEIEDALKDDEWEWGKDMDLKGAENEYSWDRFDGKPIAQGLDPYYKVGKGAVDREVDDAISRRNRQNDWSDRELRNGDRMMDKWVNGKRDADDIGDAWDDIHYEGKNPMKTIKESGNTRRGAYLKGRALGRRLANGDTSTMKDFDMSDVNTEMGMKDQFGYENAKKLHRDDSMEMDSRRKGMQDRYDRLKRDDKFFGDWQKHIDANKRNESKEPMKVTESELMGVLRESVMNVLEGINIDPKNKGKFTKTQKETGKSTEELCHSKNPLTRKRANFAKMAKRHWKPLKEGIIDNVISDVIEEGLEDSPVQAIIDGKVMKFKNPREAKKFLKKRQLEKERQKAIEKGKDPSKVKVSGSKKPKVKQQGIASQSDPKSLAKEIRNFIYDKSLKSINVFVSHSERSYGPNVVRSLVNLYRENSESNLFNDFNMKYREINKFVDEIENWGSNNEYAVYERCSRLSNSIKDLCEILSNLANTTQMLKNSGKLEQFKTGERNVLVGSTDGKELGLFNLIFAKGARVLGNFESKLYKIADLLSDISKNGRDPFDYKI